MSHIALTEIEAYAHMHPIYDLEIFSELIMAADNFVHQVAEKIESEKGALKGKETEKKR